MPPRIEVKQKGAARAALDLRALGVRARDVRSVKGQVQRVFIKSEERRFAGGAHWPPLAAATKEAKAAQGLDPRILRATNDLYHSLTSTGAGSVAEEKPDELILGTSVPYARYADKGTSNEPKRDLIELRPSEVEEAAKLIGDHITKGARR